MNHQDALIHDGRKQATEIAKDLYPDCNEPLIHVRSGLWDDVYWEVYECSGCGTRICTVEGRRHWWNFISDQQPNRTPV